MAKSNSKGASKKKRTDLRERLAGGENKKITVVYIHGIGNKPVPELLKQQWDHALFGADLGSGSRMAYWADLRYPEPLAAILPDLAVAAMPEGARPLSDVELIAESDLLAPYGPKARAFARRLSAKMLARAKAEAKKIKKREERILPGPIRETVTRWLTRQFIQDVSAYFYEAGQRKAIQKRLREVLIPSGSPYLLVGHSLGSVIAYDVLRGGLDSGIQIDGFITFGSPLGIEEVQDRLPKPLRIPNGVKHWDNFSDRLDPVAFDKSLSDEFSPIGMIGDEIVVNRDSLRLFGFNPHSGPGYLSTARIQSAVRDRLAPAAALPILRPIERAPLPGAFGTPALEGARRFYRLGSKGAEVRQIQARLKELDFYVGPIDGDFGGGTEGAVKTFQKANRLAADGTVGAETWKALFPDGKLPSPEMVEKPLAYRCLALTGAFETNAPIPDCFAGLSGDFDGQGISFGVLQWNLGQGSLQPLLDEMNRKHAPLLRALFHDRYPLLISLLTSGREEQLSWARSIQDPVRHTVFEPWRGLFKSLGRIWEFQEIEVRHAGKLFQSAQKLSKQYHLASERAVALMFDILVQNGSISSIVRAQILRDYEQIDPGLDPAGAEVARMTIVANRRAEAANPRWIEDVRARKLCIARGGGKVHGTEIDLESQYGIGLQGA